jgi:hypothetical protein
MPLSSPLNHDPIDKTRLGSLSISKQQKTKKQMLSSSQISWAMELVKGQIPEQELS